MGVLNASEPSSEGGKTEKNGGSGSATPVKDIKGESEGDLKESRGTKRRKTNSRTPTPISASGDSTNVTPIATPTPDFGTIIGGGVGSVEKRDSTGSSASDSSEKNKKVNILLHLGYFVV